jgi:hypothetical protein
MRYVPVAGMPHRREAFPFMFQHAENKLIKNKSEKNMRCQEGEKTGDKGLMN